MGDVGHSRNGRRLPSLADYDLSEYEDLEQNSNRWDVARGKARRGLSVEQLYGPVRSTGRGCWCGRLYGHDGPHLSIRDGAREQIARLREIEDLRAREAYARELRIAVARARWEAEHGQVLDTKARRMV